MTERPSIHLQSGGDRRFKAGHPWVFSNEIRMDRQTRELPAGSVVTLVRVDGKPLATGFFNPGTLIAFRLLDSDPHAAIDRTFWTNRLLRALAWRGRLFDRPHYRLVHAEGDGLPGLIVDRFGETAVVQFNTAGMERAAEDVLAAVETVLAPRAVVLKNDSAARALEGLAAETRVIAGTIEPPLPLEENRLIFFADPVSGQKTGWFFDQRDNRAFVARLCAGARVLDLYTYAGGFAVTAAAAGARMVSAVDRSDGALALAARAAAANGVGERCEFRRAEAFAEMERLAVAGERFEVVIADPPAFAKSRKDVPAARRGYRKMTRLASDLVAPGGFLFVASCSHNMEPEVFADEVAAGLASAHRTGRILRAAGAAPDHPVHPQLPETAYLKSLTIQLD